RTAKCRGGKEESQQCHTHIKFSCPAWLGGGRCSRLRCLAPWQAAIKRQTYRHINGRPEQTGGAPIVAGFKKRRQRPTDGTGEAAEQGNAGDRAPGGAAVETDHRCKGRFIQSS